MSNSMLLTTIPPTYRGLRRGFPTDTPSSCLVVTRPPTWRYRTHARYLEFHLILEKLWICRYTRWIVGSCNKDYPDTPGFPKARDGSSTWVYDATMYLFGGESNLGTYNDVWTYTNANGWMVVSSGGGVNSNGNYTHYRKYSIYSYPDPGHTQPLGWIEKGMHGFTEE